jgi:hypothetical protein
MSKLLCGNGIDSIETFVLSKNPALELVGPQNKKISEIGTNALDSHYRLLNLLLTDNSLSTLDEQMLRA